MLLLEHDAKELLAARGLKVPPGLLVDGHWGGLPPMPGPWMVKAQVPVGGRGKAGGVRRAASGPEVASILDELIGTTIRGHRVRECRIEQTVSGAQEAYLGVMIDAEAAALRVLVAPEGGVDVETSGGVRSRLVEPETAAIARTIEALAQDLPAQIAPALTAAGRIVTDAFLALEATLVEINPLFVSGDGDWVAGDLRVAVDDNALVRLPELRGVLAARAAAYPDAAFKFANGFDFVEIDPDGTIGLVTTGAGLSMKLIDDLLARGARPLNFCDVRSGQMRGDPARLTGLFRRMAAAPRLRVVLVNIFAGITELGEFARLLVEAREAVPDLRAPLVVRLVGHGEERADALLRASGLPLILERDLDRAVAAAIAAAGETAGA